MYDNALASCALISRTLCCDTEKNRESRSFESVEFFIPDYCVGVESF